MKRCARKTGDGESTPQSACCRFFDLVKDLNREEGGGQKDAQKRQNLVKKVTKNGKMNGHPSRLPFEGSCLGQSGADWRPI